MKKLLIIGGIAAFLLYRNVGQKVSNVTAALKFVKFKVLGARNIKLNNNNAIEFLADISITNHSDIPLEINTLGVATLQRLIFKDINGKLLGESFPNLSAIEVRPGQTVVVTDVPTQMPIKNIVLAFNAALNMLANPENLKVTAEIKTPAGLFLINE